MARLNQVNPGNYRSNERITAEFENIVRYINAAELGNKTVGELLAVLFNTDGEFDGPIELRLDNTAGLQYRVGEYADAEDGWVTLATIDQIRGPDGRDIGDIEQPLIYGRQDLSISAAQTVFNYAHNADEDLMVFVNGVLQAESEYTSDAVADTITFSVSPYAAPGDILTVQKVRSSAINNYVRSDLVAAAGQAVFPFVHTEDQTLIVWKNGILQRPGGGFDYTTDPVNDQVILVTPAVLNDVITIITIDDPTLTQVAGLMTEDRYTDANGLIPYAKLSIADNAIPQVKVNGLSTLLDDQYPTYVQPTTPVSPVAGWLWIDTSQTPNELKFYDGTQWLRTSPDISIPDFGVIDALRYLRVNSTGSSLEFAAVDLSSLIPLTYMGSANGVATLDATGKLPSSQLPEGAYLNTYFLRNVGATANATYAVIRIYKQKVQLTGIAHKLTSGTCNVQIAVDGSGVGSTYSVSNVLGFTTLGAVIEVDATTTPKMIQIIVTGGASPVDLEVSLSAQGVS